MTEVRRLDHLAPDARDAAAAVAQAGGFRVREIDDPAEHREIERLFARIWNSSSTPPMSGDIMRMLSYTGAYVAGAYADRRLLGAAVGFLTDGLDGTATKHLHSHVAGVSPDSHGRQVGFALKLHQRAWALEHGFNRITWTFDPLVRRNAHFNLTKLGARVTRYLVDFYGDMHDGVNAGQGSDRLLVEWLLDTPQVAAAAQGRPVASAGPADAAAMHVALRCGAGQVPEIDESCPTAPILACDIPPDIEAIRSVDPDLGLSWRNTLRSVLHSAMADGARVAGFDRRCGYLLIHGRAR